MNTPTDKEVRDWYMGYGVEGRAELAESEGDAFDRYLLERDAKVAKVTEERIIKLLESNKRLHSYFYAEQFLKLGASVLPFVETYAKDCPGCDLIALIEGENK